MSQKKTIFIGNISNKATKKDLKRLFKSYGTIEKLWIRSVQTEKQTEKGKLPQKAAVILKKVNN